MLNFANVPVTNIKRLAVGLTSCALVSVGCTPTEQTEYVPQAPVAAAVVPTSGLIGEWKLDGTGVDSKNGFNAAVIGGATFVAGKPGLGNALNLNNGTSGTGGKYAQMPSNATLDNVQENNYTISAWFYSYSAPPNSVFENRNWSIVVKYGPHLGLVYDSSRRFVFRHMLAGSVLTQAVSPASYPLNTWHHVAGVVNKSAGTVKVYVNGSPVATQNFTAQAAAHEYGTRPFRIGNAQDNWTADGRIDQVRIYNRALTDGEIANLSDESGVNLGPTLRVGWMGMQGHVGEGPGGDTGSPYYKVVQWSPHAEGLSNVRAVIALADQQDILLLASTAGAPGNYGANTGAFNLLQYEAQLDKLDTIPEFNDAVARGRIHCYIGDEPNAGVWGNGWSPTDFNGAAFENKQRWPTCLTYGRISPEHLKNGWGDPLMPGLTNYDALDYGWLQYAAAHRKLGQTIGGAIATQKAFAEDLNIGLALSMNMANAGLRTNLDTVTACWDSDLNSATATGVVIGSPENDFQLGQRVPCTQLSTIPTSQNLMVNPNWIRRIAQVARADADIPFLLYWSYPAVGAGSEFLRQYALERSDFITAFDYAIGQGASRTNFNGYRTPKCPAGIAGC